MAETVDLFCQFWKNMFFRLHANEEAINRKFIELYGLQNELVPDVDLDALTLLTEELDNKILKKINKAKIRDSVTQKINADKLSIPFVQFEIINQFISYAVGCMFGRYSLEQDGSILTNEKENWFSYFDKIGKSEHECKFVPDFDNIIPVLDKEWFEDDIVGKFFTFLKIVFGEVNFKKNVSFIEEILEMNLRNYFLSNFYADHIRRYKKRPIYWMFSSSNGSFNVLIYMHRYTSDTVSNILNKYLKEFIGKLKTRREHLQQQQVSGSQAEKLKALKEIDSIDKTMVELHEYERDILYPLATERIEIDLDDGVLVNYNKFGKAVKEVTGLNDAVTKKKVKQFDWIDTTQIR